MTPRPLDALLTRLPSAARTEWLRSAGLGAYAYHHHPDPSEFKNDYLQATLRHAMTKKRVLELLRHWHKAGLEVLLLKGFALAEFEYTHPAHRFYGDVDVYIPPGEAARAAPLAHALGWREIGSAPEFWWDDFEDHIANLVPPDESVLLEVHISLVKARRWREKLERVSARMWAESRVLEWEGLRVRVLQPTDLLIFMLLDRARGDRWGRKIFDLLDARHLIERYGLTREQLEQRARTLGCLHTVRAVWRSFDPWVGKMQLEAPSRLQLWLWDTLAAPDFGHFQLDRLLSSAPRRLSAAVRALPDVLYVWFWLRRSRDMRRLLERVSLAPRAAPDPSTGRVQEVLQGSRWALTLLGWRRDACVPRSLAVYAALRREGHRPQFVSGVRREAGDIKGHAWVELNGRPLERSGDEQAPALFAENFRYPLAPEAQVLSAPLDPRRAQSFYVWGVLALGAALSLLGWWPARARRGRPGRG